MTQCAKLPLVHTCGVIMCAYAIGSATTVPSFERKKLKIFFGRYEMQV
jgi:hypothetical protein